MTATHKVVTSWSQALRGVKSGASVAFGGFGLSGIPNDAVHAIQQRKDIKNLHAVSTESGIDDVGLGLLIQSGQITSQECSFIGRCKVMERAYFDGKLALQWRPQGSLAEALRAGAAGLPGIWTPTGGGTWIESGKVPMKYKQGGKGEVESYCPPRETKIFNGRKFLWEPAILPEYAFIKAKVADTYGNCRFATTARNFNVPMAQAAENTIVEAEKIVEMGELGPDDIHMSGIYVDRVIQCQERKPRFEVLHFAEDAEEEAKNKQGDKADEARHKICARAAGEFEDGMVINLGVGMPIEAAALAEGVEVHIHTENGLLGVGGLPRRGQEDPDLIDAGKAAITYKKGAAAYDSAESFLQVRGGHISLSMLGAYEVSQHGDLANWMIPGKKVSGMGGAMDLVSNPLRTKIVVLTKHQQRGKSKIVRECSLPLTGAKCVSRIITEKAVFDVDPEEGLTLIEIAPGLDVEQLRKETDADFKEVKGGAKEIEYGLKKK